MKAVSIKTVEHCRTLKETQQKNRKTPFSSLLKADTRVLVLALEKADTGALASGVLRRVDYIRCAVALGMPTADEEEAQDEAGSLRSNLVLLLKSTPSNAILRQRNANLTPFTTKSIIKH